MKDDTTGISVAEQPRTAGRPRLERPTATLSAKIFADDYDRLATRAQRQRTTLSALVRRLAARKW